MQRGCLFVVKDAHGEITEVGISLGDTTFLGVGLDGTLRPAGSLMGDSVTGRQVAGPEQSAVLLRGLVSLVTMQDHINRTGQSRTAKIVFTPRGP